MVSEYAQGGHSLRARATGQNPTEPSAEQISTNILANRLKTLQAESLLCCCVDAENRRSKIYTPTEKAQDLVPVLIELYKWGKKYNDEADKVDNPSQAEPF